MREIKFRAWDKEKREMVNVLKINFLFETIDGIMVEGYDDNTIDHWIMPENLELMQYTGLKDNRGYEIYEGDVIAFYIPDAIAEELGPEIGQVEWRNECCRFTLKEDRWDEGLHEDIVAEFATIIGNVYENPELIAEGQS
jgi:uncharacterized phage protein (TIGR01671 family)